MNWTFFNFIIFKCTLRPNFDQEWKGQENSPCTLLSATPLVSHPVRAFQELHEGNGGETSHGLRPSWHWSSCCQGRTWCFYQNLRPGRRPSNIGSIVNEFLYCRAEASLVTSQIISFIICTRRPRDPPWLQRRLLSRDMVTVCLCLGSTPDTFMVTSSSTPTMDTEQMRWSIWRLPL